MVQRCKFSIELKNFPPDLSGEPNFALSPDYDLLRTELTGAVVLYIEEYGV